MTELPNDNAGDRDAMEGVLAPELVAGDEVIEGEDDEEEGKNGATPRPSNGIVSVAVTALSKSINTKAFRDVMFDVVFEERECDDDNTK